MNGALGGAGLDVLVFAGACIAVSIGIFYAVGKIAERVRDSREWTEAPALEVLLVSFLFASAVWVVQLAGFLAIDNGTGMRPDPMRVLLLLGLAFPLGIPASYTLCRRTVGGAGLALAGVLVGIGAMLLLLVGTKVLFGPAIRAVGLLELLPGAVLGAALFALAFRTGRQTAADCDRVKTVRRRVAAALASTGASAAMVATVMLGGSFTGSGGRLEIAPASALGEADVSVGILAAVMLGLLSVAPAIVRRLNVASRLEREVKERERVEEVLRFREAQLRAVFDNTPVCLNLKDRDGRYLLLNKPYEEWLGRPASEIVGKRAAEFLGDTKEVRNMAEAERSVLESGQVLVREVTVSRPDGNVYDRILIKFPVMSEDGSVTGIGTAAIDITQRMRAERQLRSAMERVEYASRAKSEFLAHMSHELRTPLNSIIGFSEALLGQYIAPIEDPKVLEYLRNIHGSGTHLLRIVSDLLDLTKIEAGVLDIADEAVDIGELVESTVRLIGERARQSNQDISLRIADGMPALRGDSVRLKQILLNLLSNAVKFTPDGGTIAVEAGPDTGGGLYLSVIDSGVGISEDELARITEPFVQSEHDVFNRNHEGTGLGLALVKSLAEVHDASVAIESTLGEGTRVTVRFPAVRVIEQEMASPVGLKR